MHKKYILKRQLQELTGEGGEPSPSLPTIEDDAALAQLMKVHILFCVQIPHFHCVILFLSIPFQSTGHGEHKM